MGFPAVFGEDYKLEDGQKWDAVTFDLAHSTGASISGKFKVELSSAPDHATQFSISNDTPDVMHVTVCNITDEERGKTEKIAPGKTRHLVRRIPRRAVMYYRFVTK